MFSQSDDTKKKSNKRNNKKKMNNNMYVDICEEIEIYEMEERNKKYYEGYDYFSQKEKAIFDSKFSKPLNKSQEKYFHLLHNKSKKIIASVGPSGTGKTTLATEVGIRNLLIGNVSKLILVRPTVSVDDEQLGFLPGGLEDKMAPWLRPIYDILYQFISPKEVQNMIENKEIELSPLAYMRGRTFKNCWIVADEMQNSTINQMKMLLTRIGHNTKLIITGDLDQHDRIANGEINGLGDFLNKIRRKRSSSISSVEFTHDDIEREEVVKEVLELYNDDDLKKSSYMNDPLLGSSPTTTSSLREFIKSSASSDDCNDNDDLKSEQSAQSARIDDLKSEQSAHFHM
jgi:phosphate starvation-inducible protein PhoH